MMPPVYAMRVFTSRALLVIPCVWPAVNVTGMLFLARCCLNGVSWLRASLALPVMLACILQRGIAPASPTGNGESPRDSITLYMHMSSEVS